jgi:hypothetical protein
VALLGLLIAAERYVIYAPESGKTFNLPLADNAEADRKPWEESMGVLGTVLT